MSNKYRKSFIVGKKRYGLPRTIRAARTSRKYFLKRRVSRTKFLALLILIILLLAVAAYILFFSTIFQIKNIKINKTNNNNLVSETELKNAVYSLMNKKTAFIFSHSNLFLFNNGRLAKILIEDSRIDSFKIRKKLPGQIEIEVGESRPVATLSILGDDRCYYLNSNGQIISATNESKNSAKDFTTLDITDLPKFYDQASISVTDPSYIELLKQLLGLIGSDILARNGISIDMVEILEEAGVFEVNIIISEGWYIKIDSEADFDQQLANLSLVLEEKLTSRQMLKYIDLRFGERIFYKLK